ncbi:MAG: TIGR00730 family Rossman fold protein [Helicobacteraceae bacterium]|nr:TIGR00730 family Rossman fold protein [Helicobacteraceae bacterium]
MDLENLQSEIKDSLKSLENIQNIITIFGSARLKSDNKHYKKIKKLSYILAQNGYSIMTGGGSGIMEAANFGLKTYKDKNKDSSVYSIGLNIQLPFEQKMNNFVEIPLKFQSFFSRKLVFNYNSTAFIVAIGGFGTLDELSEVLVQISTKKHKRIPIILYNKSYWSGFTKWLKKTMLKQGVITKDELKLLKIANKPKEVLKILNDFKKLDSQCHTS